MNLVWGIFHAAWDLLVMAGPYILFGLCVAGLMRAFVQPARIARHLGGDTLRSVGWAALAGVPLPLCSCGVVPTAMGLRQQGASKSATVAFLIATPESGIDSIAVTYALLGPVMAVIRPVAAFATAFVAGAAQILFGVRGARFEGRNANVEHRTSHIEQASSWLKLRSGMHYAFTDLLRDISGWFLIGILLGGVIQYAIPESFIVNYLGTGWSAMFVMLAIGIPLYICASASTPIAAALILKGMSPGAALVFLLAGPATNLASLPVLVKFLGKRAVAIYLVAIAVCAMAAGMLVNALDTVVPITPMVGLTHAHHPLPPWVMQGSAFLLLGLISAAHGRRYLPRRRGATA